MSRDATTMLIQLVLKSLSDLLDTKHNKYGRQKNTPGGIYNVLLTFH